jgi:hypothetical protein
MHDIYLQIIQTYEITNLYKFETFQVGSQITIQVPLEWFALEP